MNFANQWTNKFLSLWPISDLHSDIMNSHLIQPSLPSSVYLLAGCWLSLTWNKVQWKNIKVQVLQQKHSIQSTCVHMLDVINDGGFSISTLSMKG